MLRSVRKCTEAIQNWFTSKQPCADENLIVRDANAPLQLLVDISNIYKSDARTGIQRVVRSIYLQLLQNPALGYETKPVFATSKQSYSYAEPDFLEEFDRIKKPGLPVQIGPGDIFLGLDLSASILPRHQKQIQCWKRRNTKIFIVVYDLLPMLERQWFNRKTTRHFRRWMDFIIQYADGVLCISEQVCADVHSVVSETTRKCREKPLGIDRIRLSGNIRASLPSTGLPLNMENIMKQFADSQVTLMVGTIEPRKGYDQALSAFEHIWQNDEQAPILLVIVGKPGWKTVDLQSKLSSHKELNRRLFWFKDASDQLVEQLYKIAKGVLIASFGEGFGLPLAEAQFYGKPVLVRDLPVFRELSSTNTRYFTGADARLLAYSIQNWMKDATGINIDVDTTNLSDWTDSRNDVLRAMSII